MGRTECLLLLRKIIDERLTEKQKYILHCVCAHKRINNLTSLVKSVSKELKCPESAAWNNVNSITFLCDSLLSKEYFCDSCSPKLPAVQFSARKSLQRLHNLGYREILPVLDEKTHDLAKVYSENFYLHPFCRCYIRLHERCKDIRQTVQYSRCRPRNPWNIYLSEIRANGEYKRKRKSERD